MRAALLLVALVLPAGPSDLCSTEGGSGTPPQAAMEARPDTGPAAFSGDVPLIGAESRTITLAEALERADRSNLEARRASTRTRIAEHEAGEARLGWIPELSAAAGLGKTDGQVQGSFGDFREVDFRTAAPFGRLSFGLNPARTWFENAAAFRRADAAADQERAVRRIVLVRTAQLYFELMRERVAVEVSRAAVRDSRDLLDIAEALVRQGMGRGDDAERARAELAGAEERLLLAVRGFQRASINLATALDFDPAVTLVPQEEAMRPVTFVPPEADLSTILNLALAYRPEIPAARRLLEARQMERRSEAARLAGPTIETFYQEGATGESYGDLDGLTRYGVTAAWTLSAAGFRRVRTAAVAVEETALALEQAMLAVRADVTAAWADVRAARERIEKARQGREAAEAALRIGQVRFRNGTSLAVEVLQAQQALERARLAEAEAVADYNRAQVELKAQMGEVTPADLAAPAALSDVQAKEVKP